MNDNDIKKVLEDIKPSVLISYWQLNDLNKFKKSIEEIEVRPLSLLTDGIHLHTISADSNENMQLIKDELKEKGFIL